MSNPFAGLVVGKLNFHTEVIASQTEGNTSVRLRSLCFSAGWEGFTLMYIVYT